MPAGALPVVMNRRPDQHLCSAAVCYRDLPKKEMLLAWTKTFALAPPRAPRSIVPELRNHFKLSAMEKVT